MSTVKTKKVQLGTDATASNNFTLYQPATPDGTLRIGVGNADSPTEVGRFNANGYKPQQPVAFSVNLSADQSISAGTFVKVAFNTVKFDTNSFFDTTTNYRFTPTIAGYYQFNATIRNRADASMDNAFGAFYKNGSEYSRLSGPQVSPGSVGSIFSSTGSDLIYLNGSTDYVEVYGWNNGSTNNRFGGSSTLTVFSGILIAQG